MYNCRNSEMAATKRLWAVTVKFSKNLLHCKYPVHSVLPALQFHVTVAWDVLNFRNLHLHVCLCLCLMSVKMLLDVCFYKATVFSSSFLKNVYSNRCSDFFPSISVHFLWKSIYFEEKQLFFSTGGGAERKEVFLYKDSKPSLKTR